MTNEDIKRYLTAERDAMKTGYSIKTWKMRLFCPEKQMIETTEALYREAVAFYYELLKEKEELWAENLLTIQGHLEKLTVPGRDGREPKYIPPGGKLPVYFRRSAMNKAAMAVKTAASVESFPEKIDANITFFKGMYKDLTDTSVVLKSGTERNGSGYSADLQDAPSPRKQRSFPQHWSMRKNGSCSMYLSSRKTPMPGQQRNECRKAPEYAAYALPIRTALQYAQFWMKDPGSWL